MTSSSVELISCVFFSLLFWFLLLSSFLTTCTLCLALAHTRTLNVYAAHICFESYKQIVCLSNRRNNINSFGVCRLFCSCAADVLLLLIFCCTVQMMMTICRLFVCPLFCEKLFWFFFFFLQKNAAGKLFVGSFVCPPKWDVIFFSRYFFWPFNLAFSDSNMHLYVTVCAFLSLVST